MRFPFRRRKRLIAEIEPDEILLDASNTAQLDTDRFEGRIERPLGRRTFLFVGVFCFVLTLAYLFQAWNLQFIHGSAYAARAQENQLAQTILFADRGVIYDRTGRPLASNARPEGSDFSTRVYASFRGIADVVGYAKPPQQDSHGDYFKQDSEGVGGIEAVYNDELAGTNGSKLTEKNALGKVVSESTILPPQNGTPLTLSIDADVSQGLYDAIAAKAEESHFEGGAGVIMDAQTGQLLAMVSYPEFPLQTMADGTNTPLISSLFNDSSMPFLNRAVDGLYTPGSIVKPFIAVGALNEGVIDENKKILSTGSISIPNPYDPAHPSVFHDWRPQGWVDMREAIAVSSDVYFYEVGGGYQDQKGIGIAGIDKYLKLFGFGAPTGLPGFTEKDGVLPSPEWKAANFPADPTWRIGDTYHSAIGQYGTLVTPLQAARAVAALANGGELLTPSLLASSTPQGQKLDLPTHDLQVAREGMRMDVADNDTAAAVNLPFVNVAAKTGTAQLGTHNQFMNSWIIGFYPYEHPKYVFAVVLENAPAGTLIGAPAAMADFLWWLKAHDPQYVDGKATSTAPVYSGS